MKFTPNQLKTFISDKEMKVINAANKEKITLKDIKQSGLRNSNKVSLSLKLIFKFDVNIKLKCNLIADISESTLHIFENKFTADKRPREAIEGIRLYADNKITKDELIIRKNRAADAASAALAATYAADAASATYAAAYSAYAAAAAATYAADAASADAASDAATYADAASDAATYAADAASAAADAAYSDAEVEKRLELIEKYYPTDITKENILINESMNENKLPITTQEIKIIPWSYLNKLFNPNGLHYKLVNDFKLEYKPQALTYSICDITRKYNEYEHDIIMWCIQNKIDAIDFNK